MVPVGNFNVNLLVGLGNPGNEYALTRHNMGFLLLDGFAMSKGLLWKQDKRCNGLVTEITMYGRKVYCLKPQTFMNLSGNSVQKFCAYYRLEPSEVLVVCDDISIPWGSFKVSTIPGDAGHNGIKDIAEKFGKGFVRYRVGLGSKPKEVPLNNFVTGIFTEEERKQLPSIIEIFENNIEVLIDKGVIKGLNFIERK